MSWTNFLSSQPGCKMMQMLNKVAVAAIAALCATSALALAQGTRSETIHIYPQSEAHEHGTALFTQHGSDVIVEVALTGMPTDAPQAVHIHPGTCADISSKVTFDLDPLINGRSTTTLKNLDLSFFGKGTYSIGVHTHRANIKRHAACGGPIHPA
ncbi:MAG: hypothetical protein ACXWNL_02210 [Vulcanimicrobiaceae bacterium]